ncbi:homeobox-domain-containing protein [Trametopsis cervina]|nr:homeobox-domain-containing protein [Trametopsis cervina]
MRPPARTTRAMRVADEQEEPVVVDGAANVFRLPASNRSSRTGTPFSDKGKKPRHRMTDRQLEQLEALYQRDTHPTREQKQTLGDEVGMDTRTVTVWFQNRRQLAKKQSLIVNSAPQAMVRQPLSTVSQRNGQLSRQPTVSSSSRSSSERLTPQPPMSYRQNKRELWEHLPSTPPSLPDSALTSAMSSPLSKRFHGSSGAAQEADKENADRKRKPILEWACARMAKRQRLQPSGDLDAYDDETEDEYEHEDTLVDFDDDLGNKKVGDDNENDMNDKRPRISSSGSLDAIVIPPEYRAGFDADVIFGASLLLTFTYSFRS